MNDLSVKIKNLPPEKLDALLRKLRPKSASVPQIVTGTRPFRPPEDENFSLVVKRPGLLESLAFRTCSRFSATANYPERLLQPDGVEIEVHAASLNFRDVAVALGVYPTLPGQPLPQLGCDAAGIVSAVGRDVTRFKVGDEVVCLSESTFSKYVVAADEWIFLKPPTMTFEQAASLPLAFITAYYGLIRAGRLHNKDRVLIHSAAGGVGMAAIQVAQMVGAEIFTTVGTPEKKDYLSSLGIQHIMDSHSNKFLEEVLELTNGEGVDVVLNSLSGEAFTGGIKLLRQDGRFVELGRRDFVPGRMLEMEPFGNGLTLSVVSVRPSNKGLTGVIAELSRLFMEGTLQAPPIEIFPVSRLMDTFRYMTLGKHIGKLAISMRSDSVMVES
jgi:epothilone synthetase B